MITLSSQYCIVLGFNDTSTLVGHFVFSPRENEKRDRRDTRGDERGEHERKRKVNESEETEETEEIKTFPLHLPAARTAGFVPVNKYQLDAPVTQDTRHPCLTHPPQP